MSMNFCNDSRQNMEEVQCNQQNYTITEEEITEIIMQLTKNKATGEDNIPAEFIHNLGPRGIQLTVKLMNRTYNTGKIPTDFLQNIFVPIPKKPKAQDCSDFRTISLISHASKILLHLIKEE